MTSDDGLTLCDGAATVLCKDAVRARANITAYYLQAFSKIVCERISEASDLISSSDDYPDEILSTLIEDVEGLAASVIAEIHDGGSSS
jgi:hypothetical protein